jgi:2'-5' RNA ligase/ribosomal protein S18 acetylase RimI-like enzyme
VGNRRRLTVALVVTGRLADEVDGLRRALGARALQRIAPHCTLVPPRNVREEDLDAVLEHVRDAAAKSAPIAVNFGPPGTFWPRTPVLYLSVGGDLGTMEQLRRGLVGGPLASPKAREERDFVPHLTLDQNIDPERLAHALGAMTDYRAQYCFERVTILEQDSEHRWWPLADALLGKPRVAGRGSLDLELSVVEHLDPVVAAWAEEQWAGYLFDRYGPGARPSQVFAIVARSSRRPVGVAEGDVRGPVLRIGRLIVSPEWRDQGVGSQLLRTAEMLGLEQGCNRVRLETLAGERAERFYCERGFAVMTILPRWREERDFVVMERHLNSEPGRPRP